ncbi:MAG TPA: T9SS type A sorting domain-containing protein [Puia sp.]|nr:T9SS type A sorting domain-containing protein [Puia sp.]
MNKIYTLTLSGLILSAAPSFAQTGGTYTAVLPGNWHTTSGPGIWAGAEPPMNCGNCIINLTPAGGGTITLNAHIVLSAASQLTVGDGVSATTVDIPNSGSTADTSHANSVSMVSDNTSTTIKVASGSLLIVDPNSGGNGNLDGVFTTFSSPGSETFSKTVGYAPNVLVVNSSGTSIVTNQSPDQTQISGGQTLNSGGTLPIILADFGARLNEGVVDLNWTTALEMNSDHFAIERSSNAGAGWEVIGTVPAHGNSAVSLNYSFADSKPLQGTAEYRLQMVDRDGVYKYSEVKSVRLGVVTSVSVYPNPARDFVNVTLGNASGFTLIRLYNQGGQLLQEKSLNNPGGTVVPLAVSAYPEGNYIVVVTGADGSRSSSKVLIAK